jgi:hypothetical protein
MTGRFARIVGSVLMLHAAWPVTLQAQPTPQANQEPSQEAQTFNTEQLDALLAPIALYPDPLLTQTLMASTFPLQVVEAARWVEQPANKGLSGDALTKALEAQPWDPSVKSLVPFPQVLTTMNDNLDWMQQLGYAVADQQAAVMDSVQRLRRQAQSSGNLQSTPQQVVKSEAQTIIIEPAQPDVVYVPNYNPSAVYGTWPYPTYPPVYLPPPAAYYPLGGALASGLMFGAGMAITAGLWNWASPGWGAGNINVNVNRFNSINTNRAAMRSSTWQANRAGGRPAGLQRPPGGPVGLPARGNGLPAGAIGRNQVSVPGNAVRPPSRGGNFAQGGAGGGLSRPGGAGEGLNRPGGGAGGGLNRPGGGAGDGFNRPGAGAGGGLNRPGGGIGQGGAAGRPNVNRPTTLPARQGGQGAFSGMGQGRQASQFGQRGAQSRSFGQAQRPGAGGFASRGGGGGGFRGGGRGGGGRR